MHRSKCNLFETRIDFSPQGIQRFTEFPGLLSLCDKRYIRLS